MAKWISRLFVQRLIPKHRYTAGASYIEGWLHKTVVQETENCRRKMWNLPVFSHLLSRSSVAVEKLVKSAGQVDLRRLIRQLYLPRRKPLNPAELVS